MALGKADGGLLAVELDGDFALRLRQDALEERGRLPGEDEGGRRLRLEREDVVAHELVAVGGHDREAVGLQVEVDAVHHGAKLILRRSEKGSADGAGEHLGVEGKLRGVLAHLLLARILLGTLHGEVVRAVLIGEIVDVIDEVDIERERQLEQHLDRDEDGLALHGKLAIAVMLRQFDCRLHHVLAIRGGDGQHVVLHLEEEATEDGQRVLIVDDSREGEQAAAERRAGKAKSHGYYILLFVYSYS